ncbi:hypothetical protein K439DRAFT_1616002 [Ramaria rubella]|nr:hypothetical protein K439DRAFT_1616002 [Ramaria rubella]
MDTLLRSPLQERMKAMKAGSMSTSLTVNATTPAVPLVDIRMQGKTPQASPTCPENVTGPGATSVPDLPPRPTTAAGPINSNTINPTIISVVPIVGLPNVLVGKTVGTGPHPPNSGKVHAPKPDGKKELDAILRLLLEEMVKWKRKGGKRALPLFLPLQGAVDEFDQGKSCGPTSDNFSILWGASASTGWNKAASHIFLDEFFKRKTADKYQNHTLPDEFLNPEQIAILFCKKLLYYSKIHKELLIKLKGTDEEGIFLHIWTEQCLEAKPPSRQCVTPLLVDFQIIPDLYHVTNLRSHGIFHSIGQSVQENQQLSSKDISLSVAHSQDNVTVQYFLQSISIARPLRHMKFIQILL